MHKRYKIQCWNCPKVYFRSLVITDQEEIIVICPYCNAEAVVDLRPYRKKTVSVMRGDDEQIKLPDIFPTRMPGNPTIDAPPPDVKKKRGGEK